MQKSLPGQDPKFHTSNLKHCKMTQSSSSRQQYDFLFFVADFINCQSVGLIAFLWTEQVFQVLSLDGDTEHDGISNVPFCGSSMPNYDSCLHRWITSPPHSFHVGRIHYPKTCN